MTFYSNPKRKQYVLNPKGKALFEDSNRFGTKMLEKMGWSKGKGLGAKLNGSLDFIRVSFKGDQQGLGFVDRDDHWTQHESSFNDLLKSFDNNSTTESNGNPDGNVENTDDNQITNESNKSQPLDSISGKSLEQLSKKSKARVHYQKFTRGKDISRYNAKDLANIFGKKSLNDEKNDDAETEDVENDEVNEVKDEHNFGITTIDAEVSVKDYFKEKMKKFKEQQQPEVQTENNSEEINGETNTKKKKKKNKIEIVEEEVKVVEEVEVSKKPKKRKHMDNNDDETSETNVETKAEKKKKKKQKIIENVEELETCITSNDTNNETPETEMVADASLKPKKKKNKKNKRKDFEPQTLVSNLFTSLSKVNMPAESESESDRAVKLNTAYELSQFKAEIFRFLDIKGFGESTLANVTGYGYGSDIELKLIERKMDGQQIQNLWDMALCSKYGSGALTKKATKKKKYRLHDLKKQNVFKGIFK